MDNNFFKWSKYTPLTSRDAKEAIRKGVQVLSLRPNGKTVPVTSEASIRKYAKMGYAFAADFKKLKQAVTTYTMDYHIVCPMSDPALEIKTPENGITLSKQTENRYELFIDGNKNFSLLAQAHGCPDGEYWAEYYGYRTAFGETQCIDHDEGAITIKDGEVIRVPDNFWLPF